MATMTPMIGPVTGLDVIATPGTAVRCLAFIGPGQQVESELDVFAAALGHATRSGRDVEVEYLPGPANTIYRIRSLPMPTTPLPPLPDVDGDYVEELTIQNVGLSTYSVASIGHPGATIQVQTAIPMLEVALQAAARNEIKVEINYISGVSNILTRVRLLDR
jgi:hypothetical protein